MTKKSKSKKTAPEGAVPISSVLPHPPKRPVVPNRLRMRNRQMPPSGVLAPVSTVQLPDLTHKLSEQDELFFRNILNPCDEKSGPSSGSKIPDGTLPNSGINGFREVINVAPPFDLPSTPGAIGGPLWSLIIMKLPTIREAVYLIATDTRDDLSVSDQAAIVNAYNLGQFSVFPAWYTLPNLPGIKVSVVVWSQLRAITDLKTLFKQVRISKSGFTTFHNAPDLYNQGMLITAQWNCDDVNKGEPGFTSSNRTISTIFTVQVGEGGIISGSIGLPNGLNVSLFSGGGATWSTSPIPGASFGVGNVSLINTASVDFDAMDDVIATAEFVASGPSVIFTIVIDRADGTTSSVTTTVSVSAGALPRTVTSSPRWIVSSTSASVSAVEIELPPLDTQSIIQSTPKAVVYPMKQYNGGYTPLRFWEPVFLMQEANTQGSVQWRRNNDTLGAVSSGAQVDIVDLNFGTAVQACMGLSLAASVTIKLVQDIEFVAGDDSPWMGFMMPNTNVDTQVISLARAVTLQTPFAYPQTFNSAGILASLLSQFVSHVPILSNILPIVSKIVGSVFPQSSSTDPHPEVESDKLSELLNQILSKLLGKKMC